MKPREEAKTRGKPNKFCFVALEKYACCEFHLIIYHIGIHWDNSIIHHCLEKKR